MASAVAEAVDWNIVKKELQSIDDVWKQPRFDSLPHVVAVLTSKDSEGALETLREQRDAIEELVDDVVRIYHNGFNKAIHNYSQVFFCREALISFDYFCQCKNQLHCN
jgi:hypothetical protein